MSKEQPMQITHNGIKCDNVACDWTDKSVTHEQLPDWLDKPCPKCGSNLLTQRDYENAVLVMQILTKLDSMPESEIHELAGKLEELGLTNDFNLSHFDPDKPINATIETHIAPRITKITQEKT